MKTGRVGAVSEPTSGSRVADNHFAIRFDNGEDAIRALEMFRTLDGRQLATPPAARAVPAEPGARVRNVKTGRVGTISEPTPDSGVGDGSFAIRFDNGEDAIRALEMFRTLDGRRLATQSAARQPQHDAAGGVVPEEGPPVRDSASPGPQPLEGPDTWGM